MRKILIYIVGIIFLLGGIMGLIKAFIPAMVSLSFRNLISGGGTYELEAYPLYARIYGGLMATMEIVVSVIIILRKRKLFFICIIVLVINMLGCLVAVLIGDLFGIVSLLLRFVPLYLITVEYKKSA